MFFDLSISMLTWLTATKQSTTSVSRQLETFKKTTKLYGYALGKASFRSRYLGYYIT